MSLGLVGFQRPRNGRDARFQAGEHEHRPFIIFITIIIGRSDDNIAKTIMVDITGRSYRPAEMSPGLVDLQR